MEFELSLSHWGLFQIRLDNVDYYSNFIISHCVEAPYLGAWAA